MKTSILSYRINIDLINFFTILALSLIGILFIYSSTHTATAAYPIYYKKQLLGLIGGIAIYLLLSNTNVHNLTRQGYFLYFLVIGLLIFTIIKGSIGMGAKRWINLGFLKFQPSELAKLFLPAYIAVSLDGNLNYSQLQKKFYQIFIVLIFSTLLIIKQPDLGTGIIVIASGFTLLWLTNINNKFFKYFLIFCALAAPIGWKFLHSYQKKRIEVFLGFGDNNKEAYHIKQSKIAIGSGRTFGKGFLKGTQNKLQFLPEGRTDFIFAVICEEIGLLGALAILLIYLFLILRTFWQVSMIDSVLMQILATGLIIHIILSAIINICMVTGIMPVVGIPLPLISYGISNLWITFASLGWLQGIIFDKN